MDLSLDRMGAAEELEGDGCPPMRAIAVKRGTVALLRRAGHCVPLGRAIPGRYNEIVMPIRNVSLTPELDRFVANKVKSGSYGNASEVVRAALRNLKLVEQRDEAKLARLRKVIDEGDASGVAPAGSFVRVRKALKLPSAR
jgi:antitoxin ParD1/3/4